MSPDSTTLKRCTKCGEEKPRDQFNSDRTKKDGLYSSCKTCASAQAKQFRIDNPEHVLERSKRYRIKHAEKHRAYQRRYRLEHPDYYTEYLRKWAAENKDKVREYRKRTSTKERYKEIRRIRQARVRAGGSFTLADVEDLKKNQTDSSGRIRCWWCKRPIDKWHIDHVIPIARGGSNTAGNLCLACPRCNHSKSARLPSEWAGRLF